MPPLPGNIRDYVCCHEGVCLEFVASTKTRMMDIAYTGNKKVIHFSWEMDLFRGGDKGRDLLGWLMEAVGYKKESDQPDMSNDPFFRCVLMGVYIRKSYSFR